MTFHAVRSSRAVGSTPMTGGDHKSPRISVSLPPDDMRVLTWFAAKKGVPAASVIRDAVWAYLLPVRADEEGSQ